MINRGKRCPHGFLFRLCRVPLCAHFEGVVHHEAHSPCLGGCGRNAGTTRYCTVCTAERERERRRLNPPDPELSERGRRNTRRRQHPEAAE